ncbi:MAG: hypothetical protein IPM76_07965 [Chloroflexi bacterium]|nr:hypothetical protein [Chloroflexota bacterium]
MVDRASAGEAGVRKDCSKSMSIESELSEFLHVNLVENDNKPRDIELILYFYGFRDDLWPTLEDAAIKYDVGPTKSRERARQIRNKFKDVVTTSDLPAAIKCSDYIKSKKIHRNDLLSGFFLEEGLFEGTVNVRGLLNILHDLNLCEEYEIYNPHLQKPQEAHISLAKHFYH